MKTVAKFEAENTHFFQGVVIAINDYIYQSNSSKDQQLK